MPVTMRKSPEAHAPSRKNGVLTYRFDVEEEDDYVIRTALIPTQPNDNGDLRFSVGIDGQEPTVYSLKEPFRSERWKENVLNGQAVRDTKAHLSKGSHTLTIRALDNHIIVDQLRLEAFLPDSLDEVKEVQSKSQ